MKKKKLLKTLQAFFDKEEQKKREHHAELEKLLQKLEGKALKLEKELAQEGDVETRKRLRKELEIVEAQRSKGTATLRTLETS